MACGDYALKYGAAIVLEDDLLVDRYFYHYASAAANHYSEDKSVAGVALYGNEYNEYAGLPFRPMANGYSTYPMQVPCSWGQCWTASQWRLFRAWYASTSSDVCEMQPGLPQVVRDWPETSWKKYFAAYLVETNRWFVYPYQSFTTNCSDAGGAHLPAGTSIHQCSLASQARPEPVFTFCSIAAPDVAYDAYMEPNGENVFLLLGTSRLETAIDTQGTKSQRDIEGKKFVVTCRSVANPLRKYPRSFRPVEVNFAHPLGPSERGGISLAKTSETTLTGKYPLTLSEYEYYAGIHIGSRRVIWALGRTLPRLFFSRIWQSLRK